ncbi:MAG: hypothetical protein ACRD1Z_10320, partial [Vicinamibacteria bacterium]
MKPEPVKFQRSEPKMKYAHYHCMNPKCGVYDTGKFFENEPVPLVISCWRCGNGRGLSNEDMVRKRMGMGLVMSEHDSA